MPLWGTILTVVFSGIVAVIAIVGLLRSFRLATKDDIKRLETSVENINKRIDRHLEGHP
ncbi:MAG: hypothetical protein OXU23_00705 [Candidatus Poribacteria bacterium]|nr:hypothetical protein [Candidatus Poribacteria bacterium]